MSPVALLARSPDACLLTCTAGLLLIYLELNRPGLILPGAAGLSLVLVAAAALLQMPISLVAVSVLAASAALLLVSLRRKISWLLSCGASTGIIFGSLKLVDGPGTSRVHPATAIFAGLLLGPGTSLLTAIARRARTNKGLD